MLFVRSLIKDALPSHIANFLVKCAAQNISIAIPTTTLLEFENNQSKLQKDEVVRLNASKECLESYGVGIENFVAEAKVPILALADLIKKTGAKCQVVEPSLEDFQIANRKACLKEPPHPEGEKMDEMRDLVIWQTALRLAKSHGGGLLISKDEVHTHHRGDEEATAHGLVRSNTFSRAEDVLNIETDSGRRIKSLLQSKWQEIAASQLPVNQGGQIVSIKEASFINNYNGTTEATAKLVLRSGSGQEIKCNVAIIFLSELPIKIMFSSILDGSSGTNNDVTLDFEKTSEDIEDNTERLSDLRIALGAL